jgi:hypothetical protein
MWNKSQSLDKIFLTALISELHIYELESKESSHLHVNDADKNRDWN